MTETGPTVDTAAFKQALSRFATGVAIVAALDDGAPVGFTCQTVVSLSLEPPLVALAPAKSSTSWPRIARAGAFCVNVLGEGSEALARTFAVSGGDKFAGVTWERSPGGSPRLPEAIAWVDCHLELVHDAGDHEIVIGRVLGVGINDGGGPLVFYRGGFSGLRKADPA